MPSKTYKRQLRINSSRIQSSIITNNLIRNNIKKNILSNNGILTISKIQNDIYHILDSIALRIQIDDILQMTTSLYSIIKTRDDLFNLISQIEELSLSIVQNIADRIDLGIVLQRITYLKNLISQMDPTCCINYDGPIANMILDIFNLLSNAIDINTIQNNIQNVYNIIHKTIINEEYVREAEQITLGIVQNIADKIDLGIVLQRILYLQNIISRVDNDCIFYDFNYGLQIINIISLISNIGNENRSENDIISELNRICSNISNLHSELHKRIECINIVKESENVTLSIIDNISNRIDLGIICQRIEYLQKLINRVKSF